VKEIVFTDEPAFNHLGTKKLIVMNGNLAARVANTPETIEHLLKRFQAIRSAMHYPHPELSHLAELLHSALFIHRGQAPTPPW